MQNLRRTLFPLAALGLLLGAASFPPPPGQPVMTPKMFIFGSPVQAGLNQNELRSCSGQTVLYVSDEELAFALAADTPVRIAIASAPQSAPMLLAKSSTATNGLCFQLSSGN